MRKRDHHHTGEQHKSTKELVLLTQTGFGRFSHWFGAVLLTLSILSGLYMSQPVLPGLPFRWVRFTHLTSNGILTALIFARMYFALATGDYRNFLFHRGDVRRFLQLMAYYLFLKKEKPYEATKYNVGQRLIYDSWLVGWLFQAVTGMILANEAHPTAITLSTYFGGLQTIRLLRYWIAIYFVVTIIVHIYLSVTSDWAKFQAMITGYLRVKDGKPEEEEVEQCSKNS